ncbi:hypothetical protein KC333_g9201 [Hortaea werneckii]|nr:hypothetical protein KC333_g9201 [Hortaea werneckii]
MAQSNVSSCISAIVASYTSGIDVLKRLRRKSKCLEVFAGQHDEEGRLNRSLQQGPHEIHREYILSIQASGDEVAVGDAIAQTSLAEILLRFNTGIVQIISYFLEKDNGDIVHLDYRSLTDLSDLSRLETCRVLQQLCSQRTLRNEIHAQPPQQQIQALQKPPSQQPNPPPSTLLPPLKNLIQTPQQKSHNQPNPPPPITPLLLPTPPNLIQTSQPPAFNNNQPTPPPLIPPLQPPSATRSGPSPPRPRPDLLLAGVGPDEARGDSVGAVAGGV